MTMVLVVDDQPDLCRVLVRLLQMAGYKAASATDGASALEFVRKTPPALVILDIMMPGMSGFDVLREIRAEPRFDPMSVVMYSAMSDPATKQRAMALGAQDFMVKSNVGFEDLKRLAERYATTRGPGMGGSLGNVAGGPAGPSLS